GANAREHKPPQLREFREFPETDVRYSGVAQVQFAKSGEPRDRVQPEIADVRRFEIQLLQPGKAGKVWKLSVRNGNASERHRLDFSVLQMDLRAERFKPARDRRLIARRGRSGAARHGYGRRGFHIGN